MGVRHGKEACVLGSMGEGECTHSTTTKGEASTAGEVPEDSSSNLTVENTDGCTTCRSPRYKPGTVRRY